uniref:G-protein coupled receptor GRL101 n=1 Tax=Strigamia maritima TaxID=126957 RepID=T1J3N1_STRMM
MTQLKDGQPPKVLKVLSKCPGCGIGDYACADIHMCTSPCGYIMSAGYPLSYDNQHRCRWHIRVAINHYINISVEDFDIDGDVNCKDDFVDVYDGEDVLTQATLLGRFCNGRPPKQSIITNWNTLTIEFSSGAGTGKTGRGFLFKYTAERYQLSKTLQAIRFDAPELCPSPWKQYNNYCYGLFEEDKALQWYAAETKCQEKGGHLVSILDKLEMTVLHHLLTNVWDLNNVQNAGVYIGLTDENTESRFRWTDNNPMSYADWANDNIAGALAPHQPDGGHYEDCTKIRLNNIHSTSSWYDIPCSFDTVNGIKSYVCKKRSPAIIGNVTLPDWSFHDGYEIFDENTLTSGLYFFCANKEVVSILVVCDEQNDCTDGSDETHCEQPCPANSFTCQSRDCISINKYCDFENDCPLDGSDEITCVHPQCNDVEHFQCKNGQCIPKFKLCDLKADCKDGSDESACSGGGKCQSNNTFQCYDGTCIPKSAFCDGYYDCPGIHHEDEKNCLGFHQEDDKNCPGIQHEEDKNCPIARQTHCRRTYKTCHELFSINVDTPPGFYEIDPDGNNPLLPFTVECRLSKDRKSVWTYVHHDTESRMYVRESPLGTGLYKRDLVYDDASWQQLAALVAVSENCQQMVRWECKGAGFHFNQDVPTSWWISRDGSRQYSWGAGIRSGVCNCFPDCIDDLPCNCDADRTLQWREDTGYLKDKSKLPVKGVRFGKTHKTDRAGLHTIGPLECSGGAIKTDQNQCSYLDQWIWCENGVKVDTKWKCLYEFDPNGFMYGCRDASHLRNCEEFQCPPLYHKCPGSYCIPHRYRCNGLWDCPRGYDEMKCDGRSCIGQYRCINQTYCIPLSQLCDGIQQCESGDDEYLCDINCPTMCECESLYAKCIGQNLTVFPLVTSDLRKLDLSRNKLNRVDVKQSNLSYLGELLLSYNLITSIPTRDLSYNQIEAIETDAFFGLGNLRTLLLRGNTRIKMIAVNAFRGLQSLPQLSIVYTKLSRLDNGVFNGLESLHSLNLSQNEIQVVADGAFSGLDKVKILDLHGNDIREFSKGIFTGLKLMERLITDSFKFCCLAQAYIDFEHCLPQADEFSSCKDLMSNLMLRVFLWALGIVALIGNLVVIVWRSSLKNVKKASSVLILSLGCADFLMGVYLIIVASVDTHYRGDYIAYSDTWRQSALCKAAGFLSTLSSEVSVFTLTFITLERLVCIAFPLSTHRFTVECTRGLIIGSWVAAAILAGLPLSVSTYFHDQFYARSGVCLALHITNQKPAGWEYSVIVFFCINLIAFLVILAAYIYMYTYIRRASRKMSCALARKANEVRVGRQMTLIVLSNFCCWMPIILMGLCAMAGLSIPGEVYAWTAVFILPLNSATNPIIYTLCSVQFKEMILRKYNNSKRRTNTPTQQMQMTRMRNGRNVRTYRPPQGYTTLVQFLRTADPLLLTDILQISKGICEALAELHEACLSLGGFQMDYIFVRRADGGDLNVYLPDINAYQACAPGGSIHSEDLAKDMEDFGKIVKKMLQIYHVTCRQAETALDNCN